MMLTVLAVHTAKIGLVCTRPLFGGTVLPLCTVVSIQPYIPPLIPRESHVTNTGSGRSTMQLQLSVSCHYTKQGVLGK